MNITRSTLYDKMPSDGSPVYAHTYREILLLLAQASRYYISPRRYVQFAFSIEVTRARFRFHTLDVEVDTDRRLEQFSGTCRSRSTRSSDYRAHLRYSIYVIVATTRSYCVRDNGWLAAAIIIASTIISLIWLYDRELLWYNVRTNCRLYVYVLSLNRERKNIRFIFALRKKDMC